MNWKGPNNCWHTKALFIEYAYKTSGLYLTFCLSENDRDGYPSLKRLYMEADDPFEFSFAKKHIGGWEHWQYLCHEPFFAPIVDNWREELSASIRSRALAHIKQEAESDDAKKAYDANKYLLEEGWLKETRRTKQGRRSKEIISEEASKILLKTNKESSQVNEDYLRIIK